MQNRFEIMKNPIFVALDMDNEDKAMDVVQKTHEEVGGFKIGPRLIFNAGTRIIKKIEEFTPVFLDFKFLDIPSTMEAAVRSAFHAGSSFVTVHATSGPEALKLMFKVEKELSQIRPFHIFAVTLLTSFSKQTLPANYCDDSIEDQILSLVEMSVKCGIRSFVCSPHELKILKAKFPGCYFVTPGIRTGNEKSDDQKRTATPIEAIKAGATALVIGRPVINAENPIQLLRDINEQIKTHNSY